MKIIRSYDNDSDSECSTVPRVSSKKSSFRTQTTAHCEQKCVQFAKNEVDASVSCSVKLIKKCSKRRRQELWWNSNELEQISQRDERIASLVQTQYEDVLQKAHKSCLSMDADESNVDLCFHAMACCEIARGLEREVYADLYEYKMHHRQVVLDTQELFQGVTDNDSLARIISKQSLKYSRSDRLVAAKIAEFDRYTLSR